MASKRYAICRYGPDVLRPAIAFLHTYQTAASAFP